MADRARIVTELKQALREKGYTYAAVAGKLGLSVASVKRLFSSGDFSLQRVDQICELLEMSLWEILQRAQERAAPTNQLTLTQEQEIVSDPKLFLVTWLVLNRTQFQEILRDYRFSQPELLRYLIRLDRLKVIELQPGNRARLLVSRHFTWRTGGPVQKYIHQKLLREFFSSHFSEAQDEFFFHGGSVTDAALLQLKRVLQNASRECVEIVERDRAVDQTRRGAAFALALRPWYYSGFSEFERSSPRVRLRNPSSRRLNCPGCSSGIECPAPATRCTPSSRVQGPFCISSNAPGDCRTPQSLAPPMNSEGTSIVLFA
jgi:transcriptional regulator with XRE-family HTH domain